ncbi:hypothetical protein ZIOFF_062351 [Zingiber officinale]|uniref:GAG-pre-integrase domain-containing protein n=1 Tax=Zingiber officinale TaxID=94328 RepID=A0A8J5KFA3_ZINOF|nr:hypothetical protein ZIOFF_062351 [Zingiber officinale]
MVSEPGYFREEGYCSLDMEGIGRVAGLGLELLNQSNYQIWKTCMESYLVGEDLWNVVSTNGVIAPANITENAKAFKKWKQQNAKAEFLHDSGRSIITVDNTIHKIQKEGAVVIDNNRGESITLKSVYHVPGIQKNLFSVANAVDAGNFVLFGPRDVKFLRNVKEIKTDVVHTSTRVNDLFVLSASNSYIEKMSSNDNSSLWHARLGHLNMTKLKVMIQRKLIDGLPDLSKVEDGKICEGCQFGKAHRLPFESSNSRCTVLLERIHSDLMDVYKEENDTETLPLSHSSENVSEENQGERENLRSIQNDASEADSNLFIKKHQGLIVIILLYMDDIILTGSNYVEVTRLQEELSLRFDMKKLGELKNFLGLQIGNLEQGIGVSQFNYAKRLIEKFGLIDRKKRSTPLDVSARLHHIAFSVGMVSRYMQEPRKPHFEEAKKILKYVNSTLNLGLFYKKGVEFSLQGFADVDFGGDLDDRRSTSGFVFMCGTTSISWCSKKQGSISLSTTEAEYKAYAHAAQECIWLRRLFEDLHIPIDQPIPIHGDNLTCKPEQLAIDDCANGCYIDNMGKAAYGQNVVFNSLKI